MCDRIFSDLTLKLSIQEVEKKLSQWQLLQQVKRIAKSLNFKFPFRYVQEVEEKFYEIAIKYALLKELYQMFNEDVSSYLVILNQSLKELYSHQPKLQSQDHIYNMVLIVICKITVLFIKSLCQKIQVGEAIQSEIFVIVQYSLLGLKVSCQTYKLILQRYIEPKSKLKMVKIREQLSQKIIIKQKAKTYKRTQLLKQARSSDISGSLFRLKNKAQQQFVRQVKENLKVRAFHSTIYKHKTLQDIRISQQKQNLSDNYYREISNKKLDLQQLSSSLQKNMSQNQFSKLYSHKTSKINFRPAIKSSKVQYDQVKPNTNLRKSRKKTIFIQNQTNKQNLQVLYWQNLIKDLKQQPFLKRVLQSQYKKQQCSNIKALKNSIPMPQICESNFTKHQNGWVKIQPIYQFDTNSCQLLTRIRNISQDAVSIKQAPLSQYLQVLNKKNVQNSSFYKKSKIQFVQSCIERHKKIRACSLKPIFQVK